MKDIRTVTAFIPAYNEEKNIRYLIERVLAQKLNHLVLDGIVVVSDGSSDRTASVIKSIDTPLIKLYDYPERAGKQKRINQVFAGCESDIIIELDADVLPEGTDVFEKITAPFFLNPDIALVCGHSKPIEYTTRPTFAEKTMRFGKTLWEALKDRMGDESIRYRCNGQLYALNRFFYKTVIIPPGVIEDDTYIFYRAVEQGFPVVFARDASVLYKMPSTWRDYVIQTARYETNSIRDYFPKKLFRRFETMSTGKKIVLLAKYGARHPILMIAYLGLRRYTKFYSLLSKTKPMWRMSPTTKTLIQA